MEKGREGGKNEGLISYVNWVVWSGYPRGSPMLHHISVHQDNKPNLFFWPSHVSQTCFCCQGELGVCSCWHGNSWTDGSRILALHTDVCSRPDNTSIFPSFLNTCSHHSFMQTQYTLCPEPCSSASSSGLVWLGQVLPGVWTGSISNLHPTFWAAVEYDSICSNSTLNLLPACQWIGKWVKPLSWFLLFRGQTDKTQSHHCHGNQRTVPCGGGRGCESCPSGGPVWDFIDTGWTCGG